MAFKTEEKKIGPCTYKVTQLGAIKGRAAFLRLVKVLGPMLGGAVDQDGKVRDKDFDLGKLFASMTLDEDDLTYFCDLFGERTFVVKPDGKMPRLDNVFDEHFAGQYIDMVQWLAFAVKVNFADFFDVAVSAVPAPASIAAQTNTVSSSSP